LKRDAAHQSSQPESAGGLRIAFLATEYLSSTFGTGGLASYLRRTTRALTDAGHGAEVFTIAAEDRTLQDGPVLVREVSGRRLPTDWLAHRRVFWRLKEMLRGVSGYEENLGRAWKLYRAFLQRHRERPFDLVQASNSMACGLFAAIRKPVPVVTRVSSLQRRWREARGNPATRADLQRERAELWQLRRSSAVYAPSELLADLYRRETGIKVDVLEPPFDAGAIQVEHANLPGGLAPDGYGLFFGGLDRMKGCDRLARLLPGLLAELPEMQFVFAGRARGTENGVPWDTYLDEVFRSFGPRVRRFSELSHRELFPILAAARFVVLPSRIDNLPNTCLEAMALERVVIATRDASFEQLIEDGVSGHLVPQNDDASLAARIKAVWQSDSQQRRQTGSRAKESLERLNPQAATGRMVDFFQRVIGTSKGISAAS